ncbi:MAG: hypothetical protein PF961_15195 [Planctomycetota bacterium]|nr:hypothetical protein [Planctomycetota bacterium]
MTKHLAWLLPIIAVVLWFTVLRGSMPDIEGTWYGEPNPQGNRVVLHFDGSTARIERGDQVTETAYALNRADPSLVVLQWAPSGGEPFGVAVRLNGTGAQQQLIISGTSAAVYSRQP